MNDMNEFFERDGLQFRKYNFGSFEDTLVAKTSYLSRIADYCNTNSIHSIFVSQSNGYRSNSLEFLKDIPKLRNIYLLGNFVDDGEIEKLLELEYLNAFDNNILLTTSPKLCTLIIKWSKFYEKHPLPSNLKKLYLWKYPHNNLSGMVGLDKLRQLELIQSTVKSLEGLRKLKSLEDLSLSYCNKLNTLDGIEGCKETLQFLSLQNIKAIKQYDLLASLHKLIMLCVMDSAMINSLGFIRKMQALRRLTIIGTTVVDGDLRMLLDTKLNYVSIDNERSYNIKPGVLQKLLTELNGDS